MVTRTASRSSRSQGNYITPNTAEGRKILNYLRNRCEKALDYCLENGLKSVDDFADAVEELTEADGKPSISVEIKHNGIILSLTDRPEYGSTTGKYMMEHLGESDDNRFTKAGIEATLNPEKSRSKSQKDDFIDELDEDEPPAQSNSKATKTSQTSKTKELDEDKPLTQSKAKSKFQRKESDELDLEATQLQSKTRSLSQKDELDDLLEELDSDEPQPKPKSRARNQPQKDELESEELSSNSKAKRKSLQNQLPEKTQSSTNNPRQPLNNLDIDSILDATGQVSGRAATSGSEVDGTTVGGLSTQIAVLSTLIGKKAASQVLEAAKAAGRERQVANIIKRLKAQSQRADSLTSRVKNLTLEESDESEAVPEELLLHDELEPEPEPKAKSQSEVESLPEAGTILAETVNKISEKVNKVLAGMGEDSSEKNTPIEIDTKASFDKQLAQINQALDRLDKRLNALEARIEALEKRLASTELETNEPTVDEKIEELVTSKNSSLAASEKGISKPVDSSKTESQKATVPPSVKTQESQIAPLLAQAYSLAEEEALAAGETLEDGIELGATKLYLIREGKSTTVSLETQAGEELFSATSSNGQWNVINDFLTKSNKQEISRLEVLQRTVDQERLAEMVGKSSLPQISFTDSQGRRIDFEVEASGKSKSSTLIQGFNEYDEVVFAATLHQGKVEVIQCDLSAEAVKHLLAQQQQAPNTEQQKERKIEPEMEV